MKLEQCRNCPELKYNHLNNRDDCRVIRRPISEILVCPIDPTLRAPEHGTIQTFGEGQVLKTLNQLAGLLLPYLHELENQAAIHDLELGQDYVKTLRKTRACQSGRQS